MARDPISGEEEIIDGGFEMMPVILISLIMSITSGGVSYMLGQKAAAAMHASPAVALLDGDRLMMASLGHVFLENGLKKTPDALEASKQYQTKLKKVMESYAAAGTTVIPLNAAFSIPAGADITEEVAQKMGVKLTDGDAAVAAGAKMFESKGDAKVDGSAASDEKVAPANP